MRSSHTAFMWESSVLNLVGRMCVLMWHCKSFFFFFFNHCEPWLQGTRPTGRTVSLSLCVRLCVYVCRKQHYFNACREAWNNRSRRETLRRNGCCHGDVMIKFLSQVAKLDLLMFLWHYKTNKTKAELIITSRFEVDLSASAVPLPRLGFNLRTKHLETI